MRRIARTMVAGVLATVCPAQAGAQDDEYAAVRDQLATCVPCHGERGASTTPRYPILAGQHMYYLYVQLKDFKAGRRENAEMAPIVAQLDKDQMRTIATYFSEQDWPDIEHQTDRESRRVAKSVLNSGQCVACHLSGLEGNSRIPRLAGQHPQYLEKTMLDYKHGRRTNSPSKSALLKTYTEQELAAVADYAAGL